MAVIIIRRILVTIPSLLGVVTICFLLTRLSGDPTDLFLPITAGPAVREEFRALNGLDQSLWVQYVKFIANIFHGDMGTSIRLKVPATDLLFERLDATLELAVATLLIAMAVGIPLGVMAASRHHTIVDSAIRGFSALAQAIPSFYLGLLGIIVFSVGLKWLPTAGRGGALHLILPAVTLSVTMIALIARVTRACMLEVMNQDFVRTARAKGVSETRILLRHTLRNALIPVTTVIALQMGTLMGGVIVTETVFAWPGVGRLAIQAIAGRDYPVVQVVVLFFALVFVVVNLVADILAMFLDPRIRHR